MTTGAAWNISDPKKPTPWAYFDDDEEAQRIPLNITAWLAERGASYLAHTVTTDGFLECTNPTTGYADGIIGIWIQKEASASLTVGKKYQFTIVVEGTLPDGVIKEPLTLFLKIRKK